MQNHYLNSLQNQLQKINLTVTEFNLIHHFINALKSSILSILWYYFANHVNLSHFSKFILFIHHGQLDYLTTAIHASHSFLTNIDLLYYLSDFSGDLDQFVIHANRNEIVKSFCDLIKMGIRQIQQIESNKRRRIK
eukprot:NODE_887_length_3307_cov_0.181733.p2 type:complete len:136 gc:universal NODE_887_length_3307_cov_0.181733:1993-1586(-)